MAVFALKPLVDGVVVVDRELVVGRTELDPDRNVRQHHVDRGVARDLTQIAIGIVQSTLLYNSGFNSYFVPSAIFWRTS